MRDPAGRAGSRRARRAPERRGEGAGAEGGAPGGGQKRRHRKRPLSLWCFQGPKIKLWRGLFPALIGRLPLWAGRKHHGETGGVPGEPWEEVLRVGLVM
ncbi:hypothetical protein ES705_48036 [subsurface metagenome]